MRITNDYRLRDSLNPLPWSDFSGQIATKLKWCNTLVVTHPSVSVTYQAGEINAFSLFNPVV
jgi:hypothetical protein